MSAGFYCVNRGCEAKEVEVAPNDWRCSACNDDADDHWHWIEHLAEQEQTARPEEVEAACEVLDAVVD